MSRGAKYARGQMIAASMRMQREGWPQTAERIRTFVASHDALTAALNECVELMPMSPAAHDVLARARRALSVLDDERTAA